ncbi:arylamine N-acetyltransferase [Pusillimonas sp. T7-7]|uniref:arylamine N-acetyltransferase family protein n=1 Tax=Pusillimonas sp. (strain T7-7) TaxID=1007105 RepID=UPI00020850C5|nr:arylamine N-acetyltransferase [Pusillimonas sp. T7-7]AEC21849.1 arylamine N-acetyltransferase [Pusillimonas sp. T7-7]
MTDIASYLELIQYQGPRQATQDVLRTLHIRHTQTISFESLSPFTGMTVDLDIDALMNKFTKQRRGGYCYEHNTLFQYVLRNMGFTVQGLAARVRMNVPDNVVTPRTHMLLLVEVGGEKFIADTGFGRLTLTAPIRLVPDTVQDTPHGPYRLQSKDDAFCLQTKGKAEWQDLYDFNLMPHYREDYEVCNWYTSTHPSSSFVNELIAARPDQMGRHVLHNRQYSFYHLDGRVERKQLDSLSQIKSVLENEFRIATSEIPRLDVRLSEILAA